MKYRAESDDYGETIVGCIGIQALWPGVKTDQWYYVEISWSAGDGLVIYADLKKVADSQEAIKTVDEILLTESRLCVGCLNAPKNASSGFLRIAANMIVDELQICYGSCSKLTEFEFLQRGTSVVRYLPTLTCSSIM